MSPCKKCGKPMRWVDTATGSHLPIDPDPVPDGNIMLLENGLCTIVPLEERAACVAPLFKSHFATCPSASEFRRLVREGKARFR